MISFDTEYFERYYKKRSWFGFDRGRRPFLYRFWTRKIRRISSCNGRVLEVGCGLGYFLRYLENELPVIGMDFSMAAIQIAKQFLRIPLLQGSAESLPFGEPPFSMIIALDLIEHLPHPEMFLAEARRVLKNDGIIILSTPNPASFGAKVKGRKPDLAGRPYDERIWEWHAWRDDSHINIRPISEWRSLLRANGFRIFQDGTDTLWDVPYFKGIPYFLQKALFISLHWILTWAFGFFPWTWGENYVCIAKKVAP